MTRLAKLLCLFIGIATGVCLAAIPMSAGPFLALGIWAGAVLVGVALAYAIDEACWRRSRWWVSERRRDFQR